MWRAIVVEERGVATMSTRRVMLEIKIVVFFCSNYVLYQQALLYIDVVVEIVQTVPGQDGDDDTGHYGNGTSKKNSLPFCPLNVKKALQDI